jgi:hypothetical protein
MPAIGALVMTTGVIAALALADAPMAVIASVAFGALGLSLAADRVVARARRWRRPRLPLLTGPFLAIAIGFAGTWLAAGLVLVHAGVVRPGVAFTAAGAVLVLWSIASLMSGHWRSLADLVGRKLTDTVRRSERAAWTRDERAALKDKVSLEGVLAETPPLPWREGKFR